jgi:hypothetical protein
VQAMVVVNQFMFSADWGGSIKVRAGGTLTVVQSRAAVAVLMSDGIDPLLCGVRQVWDLAAGACVQTIDGAHDNVIMGLINWQVGNHPWDGTIHGTNRYLVRTQCWLLPRSRSNLLADCAHFDALYRATWSAARWTAPSGYGSQWRRLRRAPFWISALCTCTLQTTQLVRCVAVVLPHAK